MSSLDEEMAAMHYVESNLTYDSECRLIECVAVCDVGKVGGVARWRFPCTGARQHSMGVCEGGSVR